MGRRVFRHKVRRVPPGFSFTVDMPKVPDKVIEFMFQAASQFGERECQRLENNLQDPELAAKVKCCFTVIADAKIEQAEQADFAAQSLLDQLAEEEALAESRKLNKKRLKEKKKAKKLAKQQLESIDERAEESEPEQVEEEPIEEDEEESEQVSPSPVNQPKVEKDKKKKRKRKRTRHNKVSVKEKPVIISNPLGTRKEDISKIPKAPERAKSPEVVKVYNKVPLPSSMATKKVVPPVKVENPKLKPIPRELPKVSKATSIEAIVAPTSRLAVGPQKTVSYPVISQQARPVQRPENVKTSFTPNIAAAPFKPRIPTFMPNIPWFKSNTSEVSWVPKVEAKSNVPASNPFTSSTFNSAYSKPTNTANVSGSGITSIWMNTNTANVKPNSNITLSSILPVIKEDDMLKRAPGYGRPPKVLP